MRTKLRRAVALKQIRCAHCNLRFTPKRKDQKYCKKECREGYYKQHGYRPKVYTLTCAACKQKFDTTCPKKQKYCKDEECIEKRKEARLIKTYVPDIEERVTLLEERVSKLEGGRHTHG